MTSVREFEEAVSRLTARQIDELVSWLDRETGSGPYYGYGDTKKVNVRRITNWVRGNRERIALVQDRVAEIGAEAATAKEAASGARRTKASWVRKLLPEAEAILEDFDLRKPQKFYDALEVVPTPATFNPSAQGDFAFTRSYTWDGRNLSGGPSYSYDTMLNEGVNPYERQVTVPPGTRVWVVTYDGQWGGYWSRVKVYVNAEDFRSLRGR